MKILVIQTHDIGDVMLSTALCNALKTAYADAQVDMMTMQHCAGVVEGNPNIHEIIVLHKSKRKSLRYMLGFLNYIRSKKYDVIVNMQGQIIGLLTCLLSPSSRRIGENKIPWRVAHTDNVELPGSAEPSGEGSAIDVRFAMIAPLLSDVKSRAYKVWLNESELQQGRELLISAGLDMTLPVVALGVNSRDDYKQWPLHYFAKIASWLIEQFGIQIYVFFGPGEEAYSKQLKSVLPEAQRDLVFDDIHTKSIRDLAKVFHCCSLYVGNDTGPRHISQAVDMPAFAVVSPASNKWGWAPWHNSRFQAVDCGDALGLSNSEWLKIRSGLTPGVDDAEWFSKLEPAFVQTRLKAMIDELGLFAKPVEKI